MLNYSLSATRKCSLMKLFFFIAIFFFICLLLFPQLILFDTGKDNPPGPILTTKFYSHVGLGNHMFQYSSLIGIAKSNNRTPMIPKDLSLRNVFQLTTIVHYDQATIPTELFIRGIAWYDKLTILPNDHHIKLNGYFQSWKYFDHYKKDILTEFRFHENLMKDAQIKLISLLQTSKKRVDTLIGVHVRRGDILHYTNLNHGHKAAPIEYLNQSMNYFRERFPNHKFIICSNDILWCQDNILGDDVIFAGRNLDMLDLAILSLCNHTVMTVGTFGWWAGYLAGGEVIYYKDWPTAGSQMAKMIFHSDFFLPNWIPM